MSDSTSANSPETAANPGTELAAQTIEAPGLPPHTPRQTDIDRALRSGWSARSASCSSSPRSSRCCSWCSTLTLPVDKNVNVPFSTATINASNVALGLTFGLSIFLIGAGAIHWAKKLMPDQEVVQERHLHASSPRSAPRPARCSGRGADESGFGQRKIIRRSLILAMALFPIPMIVMLRDLGPKNLDETFQAMRHTLWEKGMPIVPRPHRPQGSPGRHPAGRHRLGHAGGPRRGPGAGGHLNARAKAAIILVRMTPRRFRASRATAGTTRASSPSARSARTSAAPSRSTSSAPTTCCARATSPRSTSPTPATSCSAPRPLTPQLPIELDEEGFLVASSDFAQPVGPSYWERDR